MFNILNVDLVLSNFTVYYVYRSGLSKRQTQLVYSYILMWVLPDMEREENLVKGNSVQKCLPNQLVGRYNCIVKLWSSDLHKFFFFNRFITNVWAVKTDSWSRDLGKVPILWLTDDNDDIFKCYRLVIYKAHHSILCMFIKSKCFLMFIF